MKRLILILLLFSAAEVTFGQFDLGIKVGYNASKLSTNIDSIKSSMSSGFHVGAYARIGKRVYLQPEAYYTMSGGTFENLGANTINDWKQKVTVGTLDIPVLIGFQLIKGNTINWRIMVGPEVSFLVNSKIKDVSLTGPIEKSDLSSVNWYLQAGTGIDFLFMNLDLRYQTGLNNVINEVTGNDGVVYPVDSQGNLFVVSLGFKIL
jgi:hypothetical protein